MATFREYKCPCCGGSIGFDSSAQRLKCPYCDTEFDLEILEGYEAELQPSQADAMQWQTEGQSWPEDQKAGLRAYLCRSCGGEIVSDETTAATTCPFCGNPVVLMEQVSGALKPDLVIPFQVDKKAAMQALHRYLSDKPLVPKIFKDTHHISEIKGIYVPFWLFQTDAQAQFKYRATRIRHWSDSRYDYTETEHYLLHRGGRIGFAGVPVDGSVKMADDLMESIEPFDLSQAVPFEPGYLAGFFADKYDISMEQSTERANQRVRQSIQDAFSQTTGDYSSVTEENSSIQLQGGKAQYALYPVWLLNTTWKGNTYTFAMNGQTGRFVGDLPTDPGAVRKWSLGLAGSIGLAAYGIVLALYAFGIL